MRYGIYSDIHGNLEALHAVFEVFEEEKVDKYLCAGDIVGYGANPQECLEAVREKDSIIVAGNHDYAIAGKIDIDYFNTYAKKAVYWARENLSEESKEFLANLELVHEVDAKVTLVHGSLDCPEMFNYIQSTYEAILSLELLRTPVCFYGHSHVPVAFFQNEIITCSVEEEFSIDPEGKALINVGSVGQPRDGNPLACCAIYDDQEERVWLSRVEYDMETTIQKIIDAGLPEVLGERLRFGQ